jgi:glutamate synthase (NADPH/NADH) large chain
MPKDEAQCDHFKKIIADVVAAEGQVLIGFRDVPVDNSSLSKAPEIAATEPRHIQVFIGRGEGVEDQQSFERQLFVLRKVISNRVHHEAENGDKDFYFVSLSTQTIVYKGMFLAYQVGAYYKDLSDPRFESRCCAGAPAVLDQHVPVLEACPSLPDGRAQWRDQYAARQRQLDGGTAGVGLLAAVRRRHLQAVADLLRGPVRHGLLRQCARIPDPGGYSMAHAVMMLIPKPGPATS